MNMERERRKGGVFFVEGNNVKCFIDGILSLDFSKDYIFIKDSNLKYLYANPNFCSLFNTSLNEIIGKDDSFIIKDLNTLKSCEKSDKYALKNNQIICIEEVFEKDFSVLKIKINLDQDKTGILCLARIK